MALRISTALRNYMLQQGSVKKSLQGGVLKIYSGTQPTGADSAASGTLLCTITDASLTHTNEVLATGSVELLTGASGSVDSLTVDGVELLASSVPFNTSLSQTASDVADAINLGLSTPEYTASVSGAVVTISAIRGTGSGPNGFVVASTCTTITKTDTNMSSGVDAVNGLEFGNSTSGSLVKNPSQAWTGVAAATGTAGYFRFYGSVADDGTADADAVDVRLDGSISTSGADLNLSSTSITSGATQTISAFALTMPAS